VRLHGDWKSLVLACPMGAKGPLWDTGALALRVRTPIFVSDSGVSGVTLVTSTYRYICYLYLTVSGAHIACGTVLIIYVAYKRLYGCS
jgi:hypothetical protein